MFLNLMDYYYVVRVFSISNIFFPTVEMYSYIRYIERICNIYLYNCFRCEKYSCAVLDCVRNCLLTIPNLYEDDERQIFGSISSPSLRDISEGEPPLLALQRVNEGIKERRP